MVHFVKTLCPWLKFEVSYCIRPHMMISDLFLNFIKRLKHIIQSQYL